jgi:hypothetical protein
VPQERLSPQSSRYTERLVPTIPNNLDKGVGNSVIRYDVRTLRELWLLRWELSQSTFSSVQV